RGERAERVLWRLFVSSSSAPSAEQRGGGLQHLVGGADHLGVHLIGALRRDQVGTLGDDLDIGLLEIALLHVAKTVGVGGAVLGRARGRRLREQIVADRLQAGLVDEPRQPDLPDIGRRRRSRQGHGHLALRVDGQPRGVLRDRDGGLHRVALRVDAAALRVHLERAVAGFAIGAAWLLELEITFARYVYVGI